MKKLILLLSVFILVGCGIKKEPQIEVEVLSNGVEVREVVPISLGTKGGALLSKRLTENKDMAEVSKTLVDIYLGQFMNKEKENWMNLLDYEVLKTSVTDNYECLGYYSGRFVFSVKPESGVGHSGWDAGDGAWGKEWVKKKTGLMRIYDEGVWRMARDGMGGGGLGGRKCVNGEPYEVLAGETVEWVNEPQKYLDEQNGGVR